MSGTSEDQSRTRRAPARRSPTRRLTVLYIAALSAVAMLSLAGQAVVQHQLGRQLSDSRVVNIAGRQRMFSQRLAKSALLLTSNQDVDQHDKTLATARDKLLLWRRCHEGLQRGDAELGLPGDNSPEVSRMFARVDDKFREMEAGMTELLRLADDGGSQPSPEMLGARERSLSGVLDHEADFLAGMDDIVFQYDREAHQRVARLRTIERMLVASTLLVLLVEGTFVFRPAVQRLGDAIARLKRTRRQLIKSRDVARAASNAKTRFLANISHELRTPMNAVIGMTELARTTDSPTKRSIYLETVADASQSLLVLLNDLIDLSRVEANQIRLQDAPVDLTRLMHGAAALLFHAADEKGLDLRVDLADDAPVAILGDELRLRQVLVNLLSNAVKFTAAGRVTLSCRLFDDDGKTLLRFGVQDTGIGIARGDEQRIFERFNQVDGRAGQPGGGVGLGLAISAKLARLMRGEISVDSTLGVGSTFCLDLPLRIPADGAVPTADQELAAPKSVDDGSTLRILVVEDSPLNQVLIRETLQTAGHIVTLAASGREAQSLVSDGGWDAAVVDISLPDATGWEVVHTIRDREMRSAVPRTAIVVVTAHAGPDGDGAGKASDHDALLVKPFTPQALLAAIHQSTGRSGDGSVPAGWRPAMPFVTDYSEPGDGADDSELNWEFALQRLGGDEALANRLLAVLAQQLAAQRPELAVLAARGDRQGLALIAHRLAGQVSNFHTPAATAALTRLESAARSDGEPFAAVAATALDALDHLAISIQDRLVATAAARPDMPAS